MTDQGIGCLAAAEAARLAGENPEHHHLDLPRVLDRGDYPSWTLKMEIMPAAAAANYRFNPFDLTRVWPFRDYPLIPVGRMAPNRNPDNYFAEVEQAAFNPANFVPGVGLSPDKMPQRRMLSYGNTHRYRLGANLTQVPVNRRHTTEAANYSRGGAIRFDGNHGRATNYEPNSFGGPAHSDRPLYAPIDVNGLAGSHAPERHAEDDDFVQAGALYRLMTEDEKRRLVENIASGRAPVGPDEVIRRSLEHFGKADADYGTRLAAAAALRAKR